MNIGKTFIVHRSSFIVLLALLALCCAEPPSPPPSPHRIISLAPNVTEMVFALGCGSKIAGTDNFSDYPEAVKRLPKVGGVEPDVEKIVALHPDLVVASASNAHPNLRRALAAVHIPLLVVRTDRLADIDASMRDISHTLACPGRSTIAIALEQQRRRRTKSPKVMFAVWTDPLYVAGKGNFVDDLFALTGARNAVTTPGWPQYSLEALAANPPDLLLYPNRSVTRGAIDALLGRAKVHVQAVAVDENVFTRPGPRVPLAAVELNRILDQWEHSH
jgi:iron complex transport system substrate-binding protein